MESGGITTIELQARPVDASDEETQVFLSISPSMVNGFSATFRNLETYLKKHLV
jgi:hypothetical protein